MEHSKDDANVPFETAVLTSGLLPYCKYIIRESGGHFSKDALDEYIKTVMVKYYS